MADHPFKTRRLYVGATLREVAEIVKVPIVRVHRWETNKSRPDAAHLSVWDAALRRLEDVARRKMQEAKEWSKERG